MNKSGVTYTITGSDFREYNDSTAGLLHHIWWEVLEKLPIELFKEALDKGFALNEVVPKDSSSFSRMLLVVPGASDKLHNAVEQVRPNIIYIPTLN